MNRSHVARMMIFFLLPLFGSESACAPMPDVPFTKDGLQLWLDASDLSGQTDGAALKGPWVDKLDHHLQARATPSQSPIYLKEAVNGKPALRFDGVDDHLKVSLKTQEAATVFIVFKNRTIDQGQSNVVPAHTDGLISTSDDAAKLSISATIGKDQPAYPGPQDYPGVYANNGSHSIVARMDGRATDEVGNLMPAGRFVIATAALEGIAFAQTLYIGSSDSASGFGANDIAEILLFNRKLSDDEQQKVESYLGQKYGISIRAHDPNDPVATYNYLLGTEQIGNTYSFGRDKVNLVNAASSIYQLGMRSMKMALSDSYAEKYNLPKDPGVHSLSELAAYDGVKRVLDMPFTEYYFWVNSFTGSNPKNWRVSNSDPSLSQQQWDDLYKEMVELTTYLLETYAGTGKTFYLGNWEGDWSLFVNMDLSKDPSQARIEDMARWANTRQKAVDDAKAAFKAAHGGSMENVQVYYYLELNQAMFAILGRPCVANSVLPLLHKLDFISISSYTIQKQSQDTINQVFSRLNDLLARMPEQPKDVNGSRIIIGEFGIQQRSMTPEMQAQQTRDIIIKYIKAGARKIMLWQFYDNTPDKNFGLINAHNEQTMLYTIFDQFDQQAMAYVENYSLHSGKLPDEAEFRAAAIDILNRLPLDKPQGE